MSPENDTSARAAQASARAALYRFLAQAFTHPDADGFRLLVDEDLPVAAAAADLLDDGVAELVSLAGHRLAYTDAEQLAEAYVDIFSHIASEDCPPYETPYTTKGVFQQANDLADIAAFYVAYGVDLVEGLADRPDHVSVELEFLYLLATKEAYALEHHGVGRADDVRADARTFLEEHVGRWLPAFCRAVLQRAGATPLAALAELAAAWVAWDCAHLGAVPEPVTGEVDVATLEELTCEDAAELPECATACAVGATQALEDAVRDETGGNDA